MPTSLFHAHVHCWCTHAASSTNPIMAQIFINEHKMNLANFIYWGFFVCLLALNSIIYLFTRCTCFLVKLTLRFLHDRYSRWSFECSNKIFISPSYCCANTAQYLFYWNWRTSVRKHLKLGTNICWCTQHNLYWNSLCFGKRKWSEVIPWKSISDNVCRLFYRN